jgi:protein TonB
VFTLNFKNKKITIPSITYLIIISLFIHFLLFAVLFKSYRSIAPTKNIIITMRIEKKVLSEKIGEIERKEKINNVDESSKQQISKKNAKNKNLKKSKKKEKELSNIKRNGLVSKQGDKNELFNNKNIEKISGEGKNADNNSANNSEEINKSGEKLASIGKTVNEDTLIANYIDYVYKTLKEKTYYPELALRRGIEGIVYVEFIITVKGEVKNIKVSKSSGYNVLDKASVEIAEKCSPLRPPQKEMKITAPIVFKFKE